MDTVRRMARAKKDSMIPLERIASRMYLIRGRKVMIDQDLAELYGVETGALNRAVKRNRARFPEDFLFHLSIKEFEALRYHLGISSLRSQSGISKGQRGGRRYNPYAFTEQGVAMLSSVLRSPRAVEVNITIMRTFVKLRHILATHEDVARKVAQHDRQIAALFEHVHKLLEPPPVPKKRPMGFIYPKE